jgi:hypothetical protein
MQGDGRGAPGRPGSGAASGRAASTHSLHRLADAPRSSHSAANSS